MSTIDQVHDALLEAAADGRPLDVHGYRQRIARAFAIGRRGKSVLRGEAPRQRAERIEMIVDEWPREPAIRCWERDPEVKRG